MAAVLGCRRAVGRERQTGHAPAAEHEGRLVSEVCRPVHDQQEVRGEQLADAGNFQGQSGRTALLLAVQNDLDVRRDDRTPLGQLI